MTEHFNETNLKRGVGRPEIDSRAVFDELLAKPETRKQLVKQIQHLVKERKALVAKQDRYKDDVKATKEAFGLNSSFITQAVDALVKDTTDKKRQESSQFADLLQVLQEEIEGVFDEDFDEDSEG